jgi:hypothetical protein
MRRIAHLAVRSAVRSLVVFVHLNIPAMAFTIPVSIRSSSSRVAGRMSFMSFSTHPTNIVLRDPAVIGRSGFPHLRSCSWQVKSFASKGLNSNVRVRKPVSMAAAKAGERISGDLEGSPLTIGRNVQVLVRRTYRRDCGKTSMCCRWVPVMWPQSTRATVAKSSHSSLTAICGRSLKNLP